MTRISRNPEIKGGAYCIRGTRIPVHIIKKCSAYWEDARIVREFPGLTQEDVEAALAFRAKRVTA